MRTVRAFAVSVGLSLAVAGTNAPWAPSVSAAPTPAADCGAAVFAFQRLNTEIQNDQAMLDRLRKIEAAAQAARLSRPLSDPELRKLADDAIRSLGVKSRDFADTLRTFNYPVKGRQGRIWGERSGRVGRATVRLQGAIGQLSGTPESYRLVSKTTADYEKLVDAAYKFMANSNPPQPGLLGANQNLNAECARLSLNAALVHKAIDDALNPPLPDNLLLDDVNAHLRTAQSAADRIRNNAPPTCDVAQLAANGPAPRPAPPSEPASPRVARGASGLRTAMPLLAGIGGGGVAAAVIAGRLASSSGGGGNSCPIQQSVAISALRTADQACSGAAVNQVIIACNEADQSAQQAIDALCSCIGGVSTATSGTTFQGEIAAVQNGTACR